MIIEKLKNTNTNEYRQAVWQYLIDCCIDEEAENMSNAEKVLFMNDRIESEMGYLYQQGHSRQKMIESWLSGLAIGIDYNYCDIFERAKKLHGVGYLTEDQENTIGEQWFSHMAFKLLQLIDYVKEGKTKLIAS